MDKHSEGINKILNTPMSKRRFLQLAVASGAIGAAVGVIAEQNRGLRQQQEVIGSQSRVIDNQIDQNKHLRQVGDGQASQIENYRTENSRLETLATDQANVAAENSKLKVLATSQSLENSQLRASATADASIKDENSQLRTLATNQASEIYNLRNQNIIQDYRYGELSIRSTAVSLDMHPEKMKEIVERTPHQLMKNSIKIQVQFKNAETETSHISGGSGLITNIDRQANKIYGITARHVMHIGKNTENLAYFINQPQNTDFPLRTYLPSQVDFNYYKSDDISNDICVFSMNLLPEDLDYFSSMVTEVEIDPWNNEDEEKTIFCLGYPAAANTKPNNTNFWITQFTSTKRSLSIQDGLYKVPIRVAPGSSGSVAVTSEGKIIGVIPSRFPSGLDTPMAGLVMAKDNYSDLLSKLK